MTEKIAKFRFIGYKITDSSIKFEMDKEIHSNLSIDIENTSWSDIDEGKFNLELNVKIKDENENLNIQVKCLGLFEFEQQLNDSMKHIFFNTNAPAILFPYLRAYISTLTSLSGLKTVLLPTIDLSGRAERIKENDNSNK